MIIPSIQLLIGLLLLYIGSEALVRGSVAAAIAMGVSRIVIGLTLVAFATSSPELVVGLQAALSNQSGLALGNMIGSNICNICLIIGIAAVIHPIDVNRSIIRKEIPIVLLATFLTACSLLGGQINRVEGVLLVTGFIAYNIYLIRGACKESVPPLALDLPENPKARGIGFNLFLVLIGVGFLIVGSHFLISGAVTVARHFSVSETIIGLSLLAIGTSLPELAAAIMASLKKESDLVLGNVVGSNLFNILCVLGLVAIIQPVSTTSLSVLDIGFFLGTAAVLFPVMKSGFIISRIEGVLLLVIYGVYMGILGMAG